MNAEKPFVFCTHQNLTYLLGRKAANLVQLLAGLNDVPDSSIYHHTHHFLEQHEYLSPEPPNDFAYWITHMLQDELLGEKIAGIDLLKYSSLNAIRKNIIHIIVDSIKENPDSALRSAPLGEEFHFMRTQTFVFPTHCVAKNLSEFATCLRNVSNYSIYYHMFESRLRLQHDRNDFSIWLNDSLGESKLAKIVNELDPYTQTLENLRQTLIRCVEFRLSEVSYV